VLDAMDAEHAADPQRAPAVGRVLVAPSGEQLERLSALVAAGKLRPHVAASLSLERAAEAHARVEGGHGRGKIVLTI
jgi:NADPH:quinone reductase-like Zn-dependent oxidoreductase